MVRLLAPDGSNDTCHKLAAKFTRYVPLVVDKAMSDFRCFTCSIVFVQLARQRKGLQQWFKTTHLPHQSGGQRGHDDRSSGCVIIHQREMSGNLGWLSLLTSIYDDVVA
jgi:hypothetical protein